jgi:hypothetical protein
MASPFDRRHQLQGELLGPHAAVDRDDDPSSAVIVEDLLGLRIEERATRCRVCGHPVIV